MMFKNEFQGFNSVLLYVLISLIVEPGQANNVVTENRICTSLPHSRFRLNLGNVAVISHGGETETPDAANNASVPSPDRCFIKIVTCPYCHFTVSVDYLEMALCSDNNTFRCDHLVIREPGYENSITEFYATLNNYTKIYESKTRMLYLEYFSTSFGSNFSFTVKAVDNVYRVKGHSLSYKWNHTSIIESPHFPLHYPMDYSSKHILENLDKRGFVRVIFSDFNLSPYSFIEIFDTNGSKLEFYNGNSFRPPVITSSGPNLTIEFKANDELPNIGFRATVYFISFYGKHMIHPPITDCGGFVEDYGGTITMSNLPTLDYLQAYDCVWIIRPRVSSHETHLSVKVAEFENLDSGSNLKIHEGLTSRSYLLETVTSNRSHKGPSRSLEYIAHLSTGFYLRLHGYFTNDSKMAIVYSAFRYDPCIPVKDFRCNNGRCIKPVLHCDGYTHCGDGSDEQSCFSHAGTLSPEDEKWWRTLTPNYYFPKQENVSGAGTNTLILITSLAGLGMFILTTALILVKLHKQKRDDVINREVLSTISAEIAESNSSSLRGNYGGTPSDPPVYDPPPSYEDVLKCYFPPPPNYDYAVYLSQFESQPTTPIPRTNSSHNITQNSLGVENAAFVPDIQNNHTPSSSTTQRRFLPPPLLTVILPASRLLGFNPIVGTATSSSSGTRNARRNEVTTKVLQSSHKEDRACEAKEDSNPDRLNESQNLIDDNSGTKVDTEQPLPSYESACNTVNPVETCECVGACACSTSFSSINSVVLTANDTLTFPSSTSMVNNDENGTNNLRFSADTLIEHL